MLKFEELRREAEKRGVRIWLEGGVAFEHIVQKIFFRAASLCKQEGRPIIKRRHIIQALTQLDEYLRILEELYGDRDKIDYLKVENRIMEYRKPTTKRIRNREG